MGRRNPLIHNRQSDAAARRYRRAGLKKTEIARLLEIPFKTLTRWIVEYPSFAEAMHQAPDEETPATGKNRDKEVYAPHYKHQAYKLALLGATNKELADFFHVSEATFEKWGERHPDLRESVRDGRKLADAEVAEKLYQRALGYNCPETHIIKLNGEIVLQEVTKHYPPDPASMRLWLTNRQPELWRNKMGLEIENAEDLTPWSAIEAGVDSGGTDTEQDSDGG